MAEPITPQAVQTRFVTVQSQLAALISDLEKGSVYAAQSAAFRDLKKWAAKSERIKQGLTEMKL